MRALYAPPFQPHQECPAGVLPRAPPPPSLARDNAAAQRGANANLGKLGEGPQCQRSFTHRAPTLVPTSAGYRAIAMPGAHLTLWRLAIRNGITVSGTNSGGR